MKKKAIEKIPYLTLKKLSRKKDVEYIGVTALVEVAGETMLMLEVYRNAKGCKETPRARVMVGKKDFGTFFPESGEWSRGRITKNTWSNYRLIWREDDERISKTTAVLIAENVLTSEEDLERIQKFTQCHAYVYDKREWWEYIDRFQQYILRIEYLDRSEKRWKRRQQALDDRGEQHSGDSGEENPGLCRQQHFSPEAPADIQEAGSQGESSLYQVRRRDRCQMEAWPVL